MDPNLEKFVTVHRENVTKGRKHTYHSKREAMVHAEDYLYTIGLSADQAQRELRDLEKELDNGVK